jgi:hypothetical protein
MAKRFNRVEARSLLVGASCPRGPPLFVNVPKDNPAAAWMEVNVPIQGFAQIQELVRDGFLVRTNRSNKRVPMMCGCGIMPWRAGAICQCRFSRAKS